MSQLDLVVDAECFVASTYALDVRIAKPLLNGRFFTIVHARVVHSVLKCNVFKTKREKGPFLAMDAST